MAAIAPKTLDAPPAGPGHARVPRADSGIASVPREDSHKRAREARSTGSPLGGRRAPRHGLDALPDGLRSRRTVQEIVAASLREAIVTGRLRGGERLHQDRIAERLGVSRMPVREALRQLESEGLVVFTPHRRVSVTSLSAAELAEITEIRVVLETLALELAVPRLSARDLARLGVLMEQMDRTADAGRWLDLNRAFHLTLYQASGRPRLCALIETYRGNVERYLRIYISGPERRRHAQVEHRRILRSVRGRRTAEAAKALRQHLNASVRALAGSLGG